MEIVKIQIIDIDMVIMKKKDKRKEEVDMTNFNFQGKIIRHFWGKLIRQSTI